MASDITMTSTFDPPGIRLGVVRGISYGLFGPPGEFGAAGPRAGRRAGPGVPVLGAGGAGARPLPVGGGGRPAGPAGPATRKSGSRCAPARRGAPASRPTSCRPSPARDQRAYGEFVRELVRHCAGRVRYWQCDNEPSNTDLLWAGTAAEYVEQLHDLLPRGQGGRPGRGGGARRLRVRRVQQRAGQRAPAVLRPPRGRGPGRLRPVQRAPVRRHRQPARLPGHRAAVHAGARVPQAGRGRRARRPAAVRVPRGHGGHAGGIRHRLRRGPGVAEHRRARRAGQAGDTRAEGDDRAVRAHERPAARGCRCSWPAARPSWRPSGSASAAARWSCAPCWPWPKACTGPRTGISHPSTPGPSITCR